MHSGLRLLDRLTSDRVLSVWNVSDQLWNRDVVLYANDWRCNGSAGFEGIIWI